MTKQIEIIRTLREYLLSNVKDLTTGQLNKIPEGFGNNIIWNLAHIISAQQSICYIRAGLDAIVKFAKEELSIKFKAYFDEAIELEKFH
ncbi:MAG: DinB family protein [Mucilaginibacter sp.]|nr:DinB family protein [Mucilaginibacter sp.]